jgi:lipoprotein-releasing system permease protein
MAGFKGHVQIVNYGNNNSDVSINLLFLSKIFSNLKNISGIKNVQVFASLKVEV